MNMKQMISLLEILLDVVKAFKDFKTDCSLDSLNNVDIIFTSDKSLWTRVPIIDMAEEIIEDNGSLTPNGLGDAKKWDLRTSESVDKNGNPDGTGTGWGWFQVMP